MVEDIYTLLFDIKAQGGQAVKQQASTAAGGVNTLDKATTTAGKNATTTAGKVKDMGAKTAVAGKQSSGAGAAVSTAGQRMLGMASGVSTLAVGVVGLTRGYRDLNDAQLGVDRAQKKLDVANRTLKKAHEDVAKALKEHGKNSKEYKDALEKEKIAVQGVEIAETNLGEKQEDLNDAQQNFYLNLLPTGIGLLTTAGSMFGSFGKNADGAAKATTGMSKAGRILNGVLKFSPLFILAGVLLAIKTNAFGFRDALDKLGEKLGNMFPGLRGFLTWVRDLGEAFGLTGGKMDLHKAFDLLKKGFEGFLNTIQTTDWGAVIDNIATTISNGINNFDWAGAWQAFQDAIWATGSWLAPRLGNIKDKIVAYFSDPKVQAAIWQGFHDAMFAAGSWIAEQLGKIGDAIIGYFGDPKVQAALWQGFQMAMFATGSWIAEQLGKVGDAILKYFGNPKVQAALWQGFHDALYFTGAWILEQLGKVLNDVFKFFTNKKNTDAMWSGFRDALYAGGAWIQTMLVKVMQFIGSWWKGHSSAMTKGFAGFVNFVLDTATKLGKSLPQKIIDGLVDAGKTLLRAGKFIWDKIAEGLGFAGKSLAQIGGLIAQKLQGKAAGGIIQSAAGGRIMTTHGPTLVMAGDNASGKEDVIFIPRDNPGRTLADIDKIYGRRASIIAGGGGVASITINMPVVIGGRVLDVLIKTIEVELGKNMRSIIP
jgi:hypothetical protein